MIVAVAAWLLVGAAIALVMVRRGHSPVLWWMLTCFGPLAGVVAIGALREEKRQAPTTIQRGWRRPDRLHLLVGIDDTDRSLDGCGGAISRLRTQLGRVTLVTALPHDIDGGDLLQHQLRAEQHLATAAQIVVDHGGPQPDEVVVVGSPAIELERWAADHEVDIVAVGQRSHNAVEHAVLGSVPRALTARARQPVLVFPTRTRAVAPERAAHRHAS